MESGVLQAGFDGGALGFWIFIAALVVAGSWSKSRKEAEKHETLRKIMERTGEVDEARLKELFKEAPASQWTSQTPGDGYRALRVSGTVVMFIAVGIVVLSLIVDKVRVPPPPPERQTITLPDGRTMPVPWSRLIRQPQPDNPLIGLGIGALVGLFGAGLFFSSRYAEPPPPRGPRNEAPAP